MREILFRGKRIDNGKWAYGCYVNCSGPGCQPNETRHYIVEYPNVWHEIYASTVGQYTGLTDKNGKRIFKGDIVAWTREDIRLIGHYAYDLSGGYHKGDTLQIISNGAGFMLAMLSDSMLDVPNANTKVDNYAFWNYQGQLEVIGNIHDNTELLKESDSYEQGE